MKFQIIEYYEGKETVLDKSDDKADAVAIRDWHRDQWSDQNAARQCVFVREART